MTNELLLAVSSHILAINIRLDKGNEFKIKIESYEAR